MSKRVAIVGSRDFPRLSWVREFVSRLPEGTTVVSGAARGVDRAAEVSAAENGLTVESFEPDWSTGRGAGLARNTEIVARAEVVVAFWDGASRGAMDTVGKARAAGKPTFVIDATRETAFCEMEDALVAIRSEIPVDQQLRAAGAQPLPGFGL